MGTGAGGDEPPVARRERRWKRGRVLAATAVTVAIAVAVPAGLTHSPGGRRSPEAQPSGAAYATATAVVLRRPLASRTEVDATLGYGGSVTVVNQAPGVITWLPATGRVVRQGHVAYRVSGRPVVLLYGRTPAYRSLSYGMTGSDVRQLNAALVALGYARRSWLDPRSDRFGTATALAVEALQHHLRLPRTGVLALGQAVFLPHALRVVGRGNAVPGGPAGPGTIVLTGTSTTPVVTVDLDAAQQTEVTAGDRVTITLPTGRTTRGVVSSVGGVARKAPPGATGSAARSTVTVTIAPADPRAAGGLDQAPVQVAITTGSVRDALVVPVTALLARAGGGYAVQVREPGGDHLVPVTPGLFDDAGGLVQVTGAGLSAGQHVVVPAA